MQVLIWENKMTKKTVLARELIARIGDGQGGINFTSGVKTLSAELQLNESQIYRWTYPKGNRGNTGGIPCEYLSRLVIWADDIHNTRLYHDPDYIWEMLDV